MDTTDNQIVGNRVATAILERHEKLNNISHEPASLAGIPAQYAAQMVRSELHSLIYGDENTDGVLRMMSNIHAEIEREVQFLFRPDPRLNENTYLMNYGSEKVKSTVTAEDAEFVSSHMNLYPYLSVLADMQYSSDLPDEFKMLYMSKGFNKKADLELGEDLRLPHLVYVLIESEDKWENPQAASKYLSAVKNYQAMADWMSHVFSKTSEIIKAGNNNKIVSDEWCRGFDFFVQLEKRVAEARTATSDTDPVLKAILSVPGTGVTMRETLLTEYTQYAESHVGVVSILAACTDEEVHPTLRKKIMSSIRL